MTYVCQAEPGLLLFDEQADYEAFQQVLDETLRVSACRIRLFNHETMATDYTHAVVGLGIARLCALRPMPWSYWALTVALPVIPDLDVFSTAPYGSPLGHRGITHSLVFALALSVAAASIMQKRLPMRWGMLTGLFFAIVASHGLLDAMTWGGEELPFFWPLEGRCGNWGVLPVSDMGLDWPDPRDSRAVRAELLRVWLPMGLLVAMVMAYRRWNRAVDAGQAPAGGEEGRQRDRR